MNKGLADECYLMTYSYYTSCSEDAHHHGEAADEDGGPCEAETQSVLVVTQALICPNPGGSISNPGGNESGTTPGGSIQVVADLEAQPTQPEATDHQSESAMRWKRHPISAIRSEFYFRKPTV